MRYSKKVRNAGLLKAAMRCTRSDLIEITEPRHYTIGAKRIRYSNHRQSAPLRYI